MDSKETVNEESQGETQSKKNENDSDSKAKDKDVYFLILRPSEENFDIKGLKFLSNISPTIVYNKNIKKDNGTYIEEIVFKFKKKHKKNEKDKDKEKKEDKEEKGKEKNEKEYMIKFIEGEHTYTISFDVKKKSFIYSPELKTGNIYLDNILEEPIEQNIIPLYNKLNIFIEALGKNEENKKIKLYEDTIDLYQKKKKFSLLISLFLKIYEKNKELCERLIEIFYKINEDENTDKDDDLKKNLSIFNSIYKNGERILEQNKYNPTYFYGILFCYLNHYDKDNFPKKIKEFSEGNAKILYEILIQYYSHFTYPLNQNKDFYNGFIKYALKEEKELKIFKRILNYIDDIETFLFVINENIVQIFKKYEKLKSDPLKMTASLKLIKYTIDKTKKVITNEEKINRDNNSDIDSEEDRNVLEEVEQIKNECDTIIKLIEKLIDYSEKEKILAIYIKSTFWINLIKEYNISDWENINKCHKLRELYKKYNKLIDFLFGDDTNSQKYKKSKDENNNIKNDINRYYERDEFAFMLNKNIKEFFEKNKDRITNAEILGTVEKYNPYFSIKDNDDREKYKNNRETYIFDYINFSKTKPTFNETFKKLNFEAMFEENITDYINKITSKIKDIQTFGNIIKLIDVDRIVEEKKNDYFRILKEKYVLIIKNDIKSISIKEENKKELDNAIKIISEFVSKLFIYEKNNNFLDEEISKLEEKIKSLVYIELITSYNGKEYEEQKHHIYDIYLGKIHTKEGRDNVIKLVKKLSGEDRKFFLYEKLVEKCEFTKEEFFSNKKNYKIILLCRLNKELNEEITEEDKKKEHQKGEENGKINEEKLNILEQAQQGNKYAENLVTILDVIRDHLDQGKITKKDLEKFLYIKKVDKRKNDIRVEIKAEEGKNENNIIKKDETLKKTGDTIPKNEKDIIIKIDTSEEEEVKEKLGLITLIIKEYVPITKYAEYKKIIDKINEKVEKLNNIKDSLIIFHKNLYIEDIKKITNIINDIENSIVLRFKKEEIKKSIEELENKYTTKCEEINKVKDFLLFKKIFENATGKDQAERFSDATNKLRDLKGKLDKNTNNIEIIFNEPKFENIFKDIKEELGKLGKLDKKNEFKSETFISQMKDNFGIKEKQVIKDLKMIIKSKKYEMIVKSIKYFFDCFQGKKLYLPRNINLSEMKLENLKSTLRELKSKDIYDYESNSPYYRVFTSIYEKKEAIDFLISKKNINTPELRLELSEKLKGKLDPTNRSITIKDIDDTMECISIFSNIINKSASDILKEIHLLDEAKIKTIESFSEKYGSIIELDSKNEKDTFDEVYQIINEASLLFNLDNEDFCYKINGETKPIKNIEYLIKYKNKINIQKQNNKNYNNETTAKDSFEIKCDKLIFFKDIISNLEIIYDKINILRKKGFNIPIVINISIKYPKVSYKLNDKEKEFNKIKDYLFTIKNDYENQLSSIYENEKYLRLLYGKLFRKIRQHQEGNCEISEMMRYILNKTGNKDKIKEADNLYNEPLGEDYEEQYKDYTKKIFESISKYLIFLFKKNDLDFNKHYENMKIKEEYRKKGISIKKCENESMEEYILYLFMEKMDKIPVAQNILICSKETSIEEIQSFLYRAILCEYNTLFVVEILESFTNFQHNKMYSYIDKLSSIKYEKYKRGNADKKNIDKSKSKDYIDSYIVFVYKKLENEFAFLNELQKYTKKNEKKIKTEGNIRESFIVSPETTNINIITNEKEKENKIDDLNISNISHKSIKSLEDNVISKNIKIFSSDVCGLGKSFKIIKKINEEGKNYYHFPLGGKLTKNDIYEKIFELFKKIKKETKLKNDDTNNEPKDKNNKEELDKFDEEYSEFNNVAIHLDLIETKEISLINEFLFSFLITKFYTNNENIIYIPNNIKIYIEVPNSFENFLSKFGILNAFKRENIIIGKLKEKEPNQLPNVENVEMLPLELEPEIRKQFKRLNEFKNDAEIEKFIIDNFNSIGIKEYSYHQVQTFIKLYISQFGQFEKKVKFKNDSVQKFIRYFAESTKYFTNGGFARLIMEKKYIKDIFDLCLDAYENDLSKAKFDTPLVFMDKKTNKCKIEKLPDISEEKNQHINLNKEVDIVYLIDGTGSMRREIKAAKDYVIQIFKDLTNEYKEFNFQFGAIFYRDKVYTKTSKFRLVDEDDYFPLTNDIADLQNKISNVKATGGGGDKAEDWAGGYELALTKMNWRKGIKLIIHICDDGAHGEQFTKDDPFFEEGEKLISEIQTLANQNINIIGFKIGNRPDESFQKICDIYDDCKIICKDVGQFIEIYNFEGRNSETVSENFYKLVIQAANQVINPSYKYLKRLKFLLYLPNDLENEIDGNKSLLSILEEGTDNYVITEDNYKKMILLVYRIKANVPVIIMGETGCGKTSLIIKLSQIMNNGEKLVEIININPAITDEEIANKMREMNIKAKTQKYKDKELWVFFDEINTCLSLSLLTEIFINRTFNGEILESNIRLIGACNPYRKRKENIERCGLTREDDEDDK